MERVLASALQVGDVIQSFRGAFSSAVVVEVDAKYETVRVVRPYMLSSTTKDGNIVFTPGAESYPLWFKNEVELVERRRS